MAAAPKLDRRAIVDALGIAGSMAAGIIRVSGRGRTGPSACTPGWAAQSGLRAALMAKHGCLAGPAHRVRRRPRIFHAFAHTTKGNYDALIDDFGERWAAETLAFKPYPCRDHDPSLHRLRPPAWRARHRP